MNNQRYKYYFCALATILMLSVSTLYAQGNSNQKNADRLIGTWALDYNKSIGQIQSKSKSHYDTLKQERKDRIKNTFGNRKITFREDGGYVLELQPGRQVQGSWELLNDDVSLVITMDDGKQFEQRIENIGASAMLLNLGGDQDRDRLFRKWHLKKVSN
ncbi:hypothetical protein [Reichenbachiella sp. MALMAid0571]|uniref:hypothetical protein n=1 Tax=Reichenbachiella sp. MALMAid0571 TaxID=3143939 RepID=UPI0032DF3273